MAWALLALAGLRIRLDQPDSTGSEALAFWILLGLGTSGFLALAVPLVVGLMIPDGSVRYRAAFVGATVAGLGGALCIVSAVTLREDRVSGALVCASGLVLLWPIAHLVVDGYRSPRP